MIQRSEQYNSDYMSREMDERLEQLEERLTALYANAALEEQSKLYDFMEKYKKDYEVMLDKLNAEEITKTEFEDWCKKKILKAKQYRETITTLTNILVNTDVAAMAIISGKLPFVVAQSYNFAQSLGFAAADKAGLSVGTFQVYNAWSVQKIIKDNPRLLPKVDIPLDKQWNQDKINTAITHSIIHGDSIPKIAKKLREVTNMDKNSAIRNARTSMTGAENLGRNESIKFMKKNGVPVQLMWSATHDSRTRDTHLLLDRTFQNEKGYFGEGILSKLMKFPGDPEGLPQEIYNCRCRASIYLEGIDHSKDAELYDKFMSENYPDDYRQLKEWEEKTGRAEERRQTLEYQKVLKEIHKTGYYDPKELAKSVEPNATAFPKANDLLSTENLSSGKREIVDGRDISGTWERRKDQFEFEIDDVIDAQGFNGLPKVVEEEEFNKAVEESGFIAQRTYSAPDQETLDAYKNALYNGDWYVNCETGGAAYGQGMYAAGNTTGRMNQSIENEMKYYIENSFGDFSRVETMTVTPDFKTIDYKEIKPEFFFKEIENKYAEDQDLMAAVEKGRQQRAKGVRGNPFYKDIQTSVKEKYGDEAYAELREFYETNIGFDSITDEGVMATLLGYDGILTHSVTPNISSQVNAEESQHIVILNRTKVIFKRDET